MVRENGDKVIFMENGEPELVMMSFVEYERIARLGLFVPEELPIVPHQTRKQDRRSWDNDTDMPRETEFVTPISVENSRTVVSAEQSADTPLRPQQNDLSERPERIRLEDLPI